MLTLPKKNLTNKKETAKIIIIDDDETIREVLHTILSQEGYEAHTASTGKEAIEKCQKENYDIALIDIKLSDMEGTQVLNITKKLNPAMAAIMITGYPSLENAVQALNYGADGYLIKPFNPAKLIEQIQTQLEKRKKTQLENLLKNTGLSPYEIKIYLALATEGPAEARKLSQTSGVPRTKTYAALKKLKQRGLAHEVPGAKQKFTITPPAAAFSTFMENWKKELTEQANALVALENAVAILETTYEQKQAVKPLTMQKEETWTLKGTEEITRRIQEMLQKAETTVQAVTTAKGLIFLYKNYGHTLDELVEKGISIQIKTPIDETNKDFIKELRYAYKIANTQVTLPILYIAIDEKELLLTTIKTDETKTALDQYALYAKSQNIATYLSKLFITSQQP
ncbi:MAG: response regulator [Candidatus Bathyarchaeia archaeon]